MARVDGRGRRIALFTGLMRGGGAERVMLAQAMARDAGGEYGLPERAERHELRVH